MSVIDLLAQQPVAQAIGWALLQFVWQGAVLGVLTALLLAALHRSAPDIRYVVASIALAVMATLPIVTALQAGRNIAAAEERSIVPPATPRATASDFCRLPR
jgi:D-alanyl-D-alanine endopeptidase (penicillin-binding protein 7)